MTPFKDNLRAILMMSLSQALFIVNDTFVKLSLEHLPVGEVLFLRGLFATAVVAVVVVVTGAHRDLGAFRNPLIWTRTVAEMGATVFYMVALAHIPLATVITVFQAVPLAVTAGAAIFLREAVGWRRWTAIAVGFVGVVIVVRPGLNGFDLYASLVLLSVFFVAWRDLITRRLPAHIPTLVVTAATAVGVTGLGAVMGVGETWVMPPPVAVAELMGAALLLLGGYYSIILALRIGDMSVAAPFRYTVVVYGILLGLLVWGDVPDAFTIGGTIIIIASGVYMFQRERRLARAMSFDEP